MSWVYFTKRWQIKNTKIGPVLEVTTSYLKGKYGVEIRIESVNNDNSHSWVRISHGLNKLVTDLSTKSTTTTTRKPLKRRRKYLRLQVDQRLKQNWEDLPLLAHLQGLHVFMKEHGWILNQKLNSIKRTQWQKDWTLFFGTENYLEKKIRRSNSGDWKIIFETILRTLSVGLMKCGRARWQEAEATRKRFQYFTDPSGQEILYLRALQGHSGRNPIDPTLQDNVLIPNNFLRVQLSYWMCSQFALHQKFWINSGRTKI